MKKIWVMTYTCKDSSKSHLVQAYEDKWQARREHALLVIYGASHREFDLTEIDLLESNESFTLLKDTVEMLPKSASGTSDKELK